MTNHNKTSIDNLVILHRLGDEIATDELIRRFASLSKKEAGNLLRAYRDISSAEFDDLVQTGLMTVLYALEKYDLKGSFFNYWQVVARNRMLSVIKEYATVIFDENSQVKTRVEATIDDEYLFASSDNLTDHVSNSYLVDKIVDILLNYKKYKFKETDVKLFILYYFQGYKISEIAANHNLKPFTVRSRIERLKKEISNILFNSNE